ncbi:MAG: TolC family protein, partial [Gammaproteobacteria bacterium]
MFALIFDRRCLALFLLTASTTAFPLPADDAKIAGTDYPPVGSPEHKTIVDHHDPIQIDTTLSLAK